MSHGRIDTFHKGCYHTTKTTVATNLVIIHVCVWVCAHAQRCVYVGVVLEGQMGVYLLVAVCQCCCLLIALCLYAYHF